MQHPIDSMMQTTMEQIRGMVDVNTVIGTPVTGAQGKTIIPISKVSFGFIAGGGEYTVEEHRGRTPVGEQYPFAGGTGAGVSVQPVGFLVVAEDSIRVLPAQNECAIDRLVEMIPQIMEQMNTKREDKTKKKSKKVFETQIETVACAPAEDTEE